MSFKSARPWLRKRDHARHTSHFNRGIGRIEAFVQAGLGLAIVSVVSTPKGDGMPFSTPPAWIPSRRFRATNRSAESSPAKKTNRASAITASRHSVRQHFGPRQFEFRLERGNPRATLAGSLQCLLGSVQHLFVSCY